MPTLCERNPDPAFPPGPAPEGKPGPAFPDSPPESRGSPPSRDSVQDSPGGSATRPGAVDGSGPASGSPDRAVPSSAGPAPSGPKATRVVAINPEDSIKPAAARTSAAACPERHGSGSPQAGHRVTPSPPEWVRTMSRAVRASTLSGLT
ncbi:hypothetical protein [Actinoplanes siamensis]|uniref:hypothetical protein n=1 Tax=Actinoplanes siamensis TaxID=1223317 RepID=UPI001942B285|nr:hypothetical protein [Actinoplanes siamensis]